MSVSQRLKSSFMLRYPQEAAAQLDKSTGEEIAASIKDVQCSEVVEALSRLHPERLFELYQHIDLSLFVEILKRAKTENVAKVISNLAHQDQVKVKTHLPKTLLKELEEILKYPVGTAGHLMDPGIIYFLPTLNAKEAITKIKARQKRGIRVIFVVNQDDTLHSMVTIQQLVMADDDTPLEAIAQPIPCVLNDMTPQDEIVRELEEHRMTDIPVVDIHQRFVGVVRHQAIMQATKEELTKDLQKMVGVSEDERALSKVTFAVKKRLPWLQINLLTAFLAASVVGLFEGTIAQYTALAVLLPVVAGQSGNTGAQALAVTMRGLALKEVRTSQWALLLYKELRVSFLTGLAVALTTSIGVLFWSGSFGLMLIIGISMVMSMILASVSGAAVPLILVRLGQDPAASSSILLTTVTDVCGFFSFLGIATLLANLI